MVDDVAQDSERRRRGDATEGDSDDGLSRFAYKSSRPRPSLDPAPSRPARVVRKDRPDTQLVQLPRCIACGLQWTSKKSANQKRTHIQQCAKKNALSKDTLKFLIEKEIAILASSPTPTTPSGKNATTTLMDSVAPTDPTRKPKRQQVIPTLRSLPETREIILHRARDVLGPTKGQVDPQPTQQFGQSELARRNKRLALPHVNRSMEECPSTQPFGTSSLCGRVINSERSAGGREEPSPFPAQRCSTSMTFRFVE